jgi:hypothetical protein
MLCYTMKFVVIIRVGERYFKELKLGGDVKFRSYTLILDTNTTHDVTEGVAEASEISLSFLSLTKIMKVRI